MASDRSVSISGDDGMQQLLSTADDDAFRPHTVAHRCISQASAQKLFSQKFGGKFEYEKSKNAPLLVSVRNHNRYARDKKQDIRRER